MKILFVSYAYPPISSPGAMRIYNFAKDLCELGHDVTVLTSSNGYSSMIDSNEHDNGNVNVIKTRDLLSKQAYNGKRQSENLKKINIIGIASKIIYPDRDITWLPTALSSSEIKKMNFDIVLGSYPNVTNLLIATRIANRHKAKLVLDMRDLWTDEYENNEKISFKTKLNKILESYLFKKADGIINVSNVNTNFIYNKIKNKSLCTVRNGFDYDLIKSVRESFKEEKSDKFIISYSGSFVGGERDPRDLFKAIVKLETAGLVSKDNFSFDIYGPKEEIIEEWVKEFKITHLVCFKGMLSRSILFNSLMSSNILFALTRTTPISAGEMTTKVFEYIGLGNDILCICKPEYEIENILNKVKSAYVVYFADVNGIVEYLTKKISNNKDNYIFRAPLTKEFSRKQAAEELACFLENL